MITGYLCKCDNDNCKKEFIIKYVKIKNIAMDETYCPKCKDKKREVKNANS